MEASSATLGLVLSAALVATAMSQAVKFNCPQLPPLKSPAETVYELHPQDVRVVMAFGDSITAGEALRPLACNKALAPVASSL